MKKDLGNPSSTRSLARRNHGYTAHRVAYQAIPGAGITPEITQRDHLEARPICETPSSPWHCAPFAANVKWLYSASALNSAGVYKATPRT